MNPVDYDVAIVGGGLAGASLAVALSATHLKVVLIEAIPDAAKLESQAGDRAIALSGGSVDLLKSLGLWEGVEDKSAPITHIHVSDRGHFGKARLSAGQEHVEALGYVVVARELERQAMAAMERLNISRIVPARVVGLGTGPDSVSLSIRQGDETSHLSARLLVGADGGDSSIRRLLEIGERTTDYGQTAVIATIRPQKDPAGKAFERFTADGPLAMLPTENRCCAVVWTQPPEQAARRMAMDEGQFCAELQDYFGWWLGRLSLAAPRRAFPLKLIRAERLYAPRAVLIGNAVHQVHPVTGQGFNLGLRDAAYLAEILAETAHAGGDVGLPYLLQHYAVQRQADHDKIIGFTDTLVHWFSTAEPASGLLRNIGTTLLDHFPPAKRYLVRHAMGIAGRMPRLPFVQRN